MADLIGGGDGCLVKQAVALPVTSVRDSLEHLVADEAMTPGNAGHYIALCGRDVSAAALACPAGPPCPACVTARTSDAANQRRRHRQDRPGIWAWLNPARLRRHRRLAGPVPFPDIALPLAEPKSPRPRQGLIPPPSVHQRLPR